MRLCLVAVVAVAAACDGPARATPRCALPPRDCSGSAAHCAALVPFAPARGPGYEDVPLSDEVDAAHSTSYLRRDLRMHVQYATAKTACLAATWPGRPGPIALGDMSDRDGAVPGTRRDRPRHPPGTHTAGRDIDLAYFQVGTPDHRIRAICPHVQGDIDQRHCVGPPTRLDARRTALLIGVLFESPRVRIIGIDAAAALPIQAALAELCTDGVVHADACARVRLGVEPVDTGRGWFHAHHNHMHVSWLDASPALTE